MSLANVFWSGLFVICFVPSCESSEISEKFPEDIDVSLTLDDIGDAAYERLCSTFESWVRDTYASSYLVEAVCTALAVEQSGDRTACGEYIVECKNTLPPEAETLLSSILEQTYCSQVGVERSGCLATVGEIRACLESISDRVSEIRYSLTCAAVGQPQGEGWWTVELPQSCMMIQNQCD